ncbi:MAG: hypothetical protein LBQ43_02555 [Holosporales bacterium]|nr:hypothetical protein [Holosporales bacterium]
MLYIMVTILRFKMCGLSEISDRNNGAGAGISTLLSSSARISFIAAAFFFWPLRQISRIPH